MSKAVAFQAAGKQDTGEKENRRQKLSIRRRDGGRGASTERMGRGCQERGKMPGQRGHPLAEQMEL